MTPMRTLRAWLLRVAGLFAKERRDRELAAEIESNLRLHIEDNLRAGMTPGEARRQALLKFGGIESAKEGYRDRRGIPLLETTWQDVRFALRMLRKSPGFTAVAILTLALGIGANTAIFSMVDWLVVQMPPVSHPRQIVTLATRRIDGGYDNGFSYPNFQDIRKQAASVFSEMAATRDFGTDGLSVGNNDEPIWTNYVTSNFFQVLGIRPALGRLIRPQPDRLAGDDPVLVLSYAFWQAHFAGDPSIIGKAASINGHPVTIIGVAPKGFHGITPLLDAQGYLPLGMAIGTSDVKKDFLADRKAPDLTVFARLRPGVTKSLAAPALNVIARRLSARYPTVDKWSSLVSYPLGPLSPVSDPSSPRSMLLMSTLFLILAGLVLVLACLNVSNLLLARALVRQHEMCIRAAVGAARGRLIRQLLTESVLLAFLGCAAGIVMGLLSSRWIGSLNLKTAIPIVLDFQFDWPVFAYAFAAALATAAVVGIAPAMRATRGKLAELLHEAARTTTAPHQRTRAALVIAQVGGSVMLLIVAGLFVRSLRGVQHSNLGFNPTGVLNFTVDPREAGYNQAQGSDFLQDLLPRVRALPGVEAASLAATVPMGYYSFGRNLKVEGYQPPRHETPRAGYNAVSPDYFETMGIPILRGRTFLDSDGQNSQHVAVINEATAEKYWHGENPIGMRFTTTDDPNHPIEIVGEAKNSRTDQLYGSYDPYMYVPLAQAYQVPITLQVRTALPLATMGNEIVGTIHSLAPAMPVYDVQTMAEALDTLNGLLLFQIGAGLAAALGILGLTLAVIGVYGVVSYGASQRTHEIGIRMALGAKPAHILKMIFGQGLLIIIGGVVLGALAAAGFGSLVGDFLVDVSPFDAVTYFAAISVLGAVALAACYVPARRAMRVDPMVALRHE
jgi:predicted permease